MKSSCTRSSGTTLPVGTWLGAGDGFMDRDGEFVGKGVGWFVGEPVGLVEGRSVGLELG